MSPGATTRRIEGQFYPKIWGAACIGPWFEERRGELIGEVWFPADPLLVKFLFTSDRLSVQVHPDDAYARRHEGSLGKTEMWHILRASEGAQIALGFKRPISPDQLIPAAESGEIMGLLNWIDVHPGETYFVPPGTVHAIGAGIALCEVQQNSDLTYRLFDYGRPRQLHLRQAQEVSYLGSHAGMALPRDLGDGVQLLVESPYFRTYRAVVERTQLFGSEFTPPRDARLLVVVEGAGQVNGLPASPGNVFATTVPERWLVEPESTSPSGPLTLLLIA